MLHTYNTHKMYYFLSHDEYTRGFKFYKILNT